MSRKKAAWLLGGVGVILLIVLAFTMTWYKQSPKIPLTLLTQLENEMGADLSMHFGKPTSPTLTDRLFGYKSHRYRITSIIELSQSPVKQCIQVRVVYQIPGQTSIYLSDYPAENFLYLAWQRDEQWGIQKIQQSGIDTGNRQDLLWLEGLISQSMDQHLPGDDSLAYPMTQEDRQRCILSALEDQ